MLENAGARMHLAEGAMAAHLPIMSDDDQLTRIDGANMVGAYYVKGDGFRRENGGVAQFAHDQRPDAERVAARDHALGRGHD